MSLLSRIIPSTIEIELRATILKDFERDAEAFDGFTKPEMEIDLRMDRLYTQLLFVRDMMSQVEKDILAFDPRWQEHITAERLLESA